MDGAPAEPKQVEQLVKEADPKLLSSLSSDSRRRVLRLIPKVTSFLVHQQTSFSGPIPPTDMLRDYNEIIPNGAERIMTMAESQSTHRQALESQVVTKQLAESSRGQIFAFILALLLIGAGIYAIHAGCSAVASVIFGTTVVGLASVFVLGKVFQRKNLSSKKPKDQA